MPKKPPARKIPARKVLADELVITVDGVDYHPHEGEYVIFRGTAQTVGEYLDGLELQTIGLQGAKAEDGGDNLSDSELEVTRRASELFARTVEGIAARVVEWDWTDNDDNPYPSPPTAEVIKSLTFEELNWLGRGGRKTESPLAVESPSTAPSTA